MATYVFLDCGPLTLACKGRNNPKAIACRAWIEGLRGKDFIVVIPEIADYEARREMIRIGADDWIARLDGLTSHVFYLRLTTDAMRQAARFWALVRKVGLPTADKEALDADAILAAQAVTAAQPGDRVIVATTNIGHLGRFPGVEPQPWDFVQ